MRTRRSGVISPAFEGKNRHRFLLLLLLLLLLERGPALAAAQSRPPNGNWPSFRGPGARGIAEGIATPTTWDVDDGKNVRWKTPIPGLGHSSPIVWGNRIFVTSAISGQAKPELKVGLYGDVTPVTDDTVHQWKVYCLDKRTGRFIWERTAHTGVPKVRRHPKSTQANPTMATDGRNVVAFFGSEGLYCYDFQGRLRWRKDLGLLDSGWYVSPSAQWGFASSPVIDGDMVLVQCDVTSAARSPQSSIDLPVGGAPIQGSGKTESQTDRSEGSPADEVRQHSFVGAFRIKDGSEIWRTARDDVPTWSTPTVHREGERAQLIVNGYRHIGGYDLRTGKELWRLQGGGDIPVPTPVVANDLVFITNAHGRMAPIYAIRTSAVGDISLQGTESANRYVAWSRPRDGGYMQTPLVYGDHLYICRDNGVLTCYEAKTGNPLYEERLGTGRSGFTASPVAAGGKLYFTSEDGDIYVVQAGPTFKLLSVNPMGEICMATPAISEGTLFFRTQGHLIAVAEPARPQAK
jgi:outer membrane protein assembly factor BamB